MSIMQLDTGGAVEIAVKPVKPATATTATPVEEAPEPAVSEQPRVVPRPSLQANFYYDQQLNQLTITLTDPETGDVVRQIPDEHMRRFIAGMMELAGKVFDTRV